MKLKLVESKKEEIPIIAEIYKTEFSKPPYNEPWTIRKAVDKMRFFIKYYDLYTIKADKEIVGFICVNPLFMCPGEVAFGEELAIKEEFQNKGIGTWTLKEIFEIYRKKGFKRFMGVLEEGARVVSLYNRLNIKPSKKYKLIEKKLK